MKLSDLPVSTRVDLTRHAGAIVSALDSIVRNLGGYYNYYTIVEDAPCSMRILTQKNCAGFVRLPKPHTPAQVVEQLTKMEPETRRPNPHPPNTNRGWEIRTCLVEGLPAAIIAAAWV